MSKKFQQISLKPGFMKHNGGLFFRKISNKNYEFKTKIKKYITDFSKEIFIFNLFGGPRRT